MDLVLAGSAAVVTGGSKGMGLAIAETLAAEGARVAERWGEINSLVHTIGPGDGYFDEMDDAQWEAAFTLGTMSGVR